MKRYYPAVCPHCRGKGIIIEYDSQVIGFTNKTCPVCEGKRRITITEETSEALPDLQRHSPEIGNVVYVFETTPKNN